MGPLEDILNENLVHSLSGTTVDRESIFKHSRSLAGPDGGLVAFDKTDCGCGNANVGTLNKNGRGAAKELIPDRIVFKRIRELWSK